ncbi:hypothetical protein BEWA_003450 [Theileria equi strain WA]|uniref:Signal peptide containing protein n=1 Tax=Theileria equi strain WA TaxID=1537102 RepID=L0AZD1_THEEQ|nr:hypothetical protein BEWA_003450 [Theileria equi strain WA]AFZ80937.1 hypothetical protein BEWA_003450 [Theileria equi strain WA]|eukprot:XP_004830603.1 hypothetical protein BEWA_003450 [Theileria equi strain WA]
MRFLPSYLVILFIICTAFLLTRRNSGIDTVEIGDDVAGNVRGKSSGKGDKAPCGKPVETRSNIKDRRDQLKRNSQGPETATLEDPLVLAEVSYSSPFDEPPTDDHIDVPSPEIQPEEQSSSEFHKNEPESREPKEEASIEALLDLPDHIPEHPQEFEDEDEDPEFHDGFWDTPDDYSERQDDTQDEPDGLVIDEVEDDEVEDIGEEDEEGEEELGEFEEYVPETEVEESETIVGDFSDSEPVLEIPYTEVSVYYSSNDQPENGSEKEFGDSESTGYESSDNNLPETKVEEPEEPTKPEKPASSLASKVDGSLFDVEEAEEDNVKVLKLLTRDGAVAKRVKYDGEEIWSGVRRFSTFLCSYAVLYMDGDRPTLAVIKTNGLCNTEPTVYKYYNGTKWQSHDAYWHKNELEALKEKYRPTSSIALDLVNPDETNIDIDEYTESGVTVKEFSPKDDFHISSVMDSCKELWNAGAGQKCFLVEHYEKNNVTILYLETDDGNDTKSKCFEKTGNEWKNIGREVFVEKLMTMIKESVGSTSDTPQDTHLDTSFHKKGVTVTKVVDGDGDIYTLSSGEAFDHAKVYLNKDGKPELVLVVTKRADTSKETYLELKDGKWVSCDDHDAKIKSLKDTTEWKSDFEIDLSLANSTNECSIFETELLGVTTRHFYPKPGHAPIKVQDGNKELWKSTTCATKFGSNSSDSCLSCLIYEKGDIKILEMITVERLTRRWKYFERTGTEWKSITKKEDFDKKLSEISKYRLSSSNPTTSTLAPTKPSGN